MTSVLYVIPEAYGLTLVAEVDGDEPYEFDIVAVWRASDGKLWAARDAGCSCPMPFEDHTFPTDFVEVRSLDDLQPLLDERNGGGDVLAFTTRIREELAR